MPPPLGKRDKAAETCSSGLSSSRGSAGRSEMPFMDVAAFSKFLDLAKEFTHSWF